MVNENDLVRKAAKRVLQHWPRAFYWKINDMKTIGMPDSLLAHDGIVVFVEFKRMSPGETIHTKGKVKEIQWMKLRQLNAAGLHAFLVAFARQKDGSWTELVYRSDKSQAPYSFLELLQSLWQ